MRAVLPAALLAALLAAAPARAQAPGCDPDVAAAMAEAAGKGVRDDLRVIRDPDQGVRDPTALTGLTCLDRLFDFKSFDIFYDPSSAFDRALGLAERAVCDAAGNAHAQALARVPDVSVFTRSASVLPGLEVGSRGGSLLDPKDRAAAAAPPRVRPVDPLEPADRRLRNWRRAVGGGDGQ